MEQKATTSEDEVSAYFMGFFSNEFVKRYPIWRYHKVLEPILVTNTEEDEKFREIGYGKFEIPLTANDHLINWFWDFEDMSTRQLQVYAKEEYGVDLPIEAGQERLFKAVLELGKSAPQNQNRIVLMAHTMAMNYDETLLTIKKMINQDDAVTETYTVEL